MGEYEVIYTTKISDFIPKDSEIIVMVEGDLNNDNLKDLVIITENQTFKMKDGSSCVKEFSEECPRSLLILFQTKDGNYKLSIKSDKAILLANDGGIMGDPLGNIIIDNGSLMISFYGGSSWRWSDSYNFRYQNGEWYLIGKEANSLWNVFPDKVTQTKEYNYLTGLMKKTTGSGWGLDLTVEELEKLPYEDDKVEWINFEKKEIKMKDFDIYLQINNPCYGIPEGECRE